MVVIDQLTKFTSVRAALTLFEPLQLNLQLADLLESSASLTWLSPVSLLFLPLVNSSLAPSRSCRFLWLTWIGWMA